MQASQENRVGISYISMSVFAMEDRLTLLLLIF